jgi:hypothetical protein
VKPRQQEPSLRKQLPEQGTSRRPPPKNQEGACHFGIGDYGPKPLTLTGIGLLTVVPSPSSPSAL